MDIIIYTIRVSKKGGSKMISERTLRKWRGDALKEKELMENRSDHQNFVDMVIKLTQELLDQHLVRKS